MKAIVFTCLLATVVFTEASNKASDCVDDNEVYRNWIFSNAMPKAFDYLGQLMERDFEVILPVANVRNWDTYCRELANIRSCVAAKDDTVEDKRRGLAIIDKLSPLVCTQEIKAKFPCLLNVSQHPTQQCQTKCQQYKGSLMTGINELADNDTISTNSLKAACQYVNCRVSCRKDDITASCEPAGLEAAKKLMESVASLAQTVHQEFRQEVGRGPRKPYPEECTPENLIKLV